MHGKEETAIRFERSWAKLRKPSVKQGRVFCLRTVHLALLDAAACDIDAQVRKSYEERRRKRHVKGQGRSWKLKRMAMDSDDTMQLKKGQQAQADKRQQDLERFMQVFSCLLHFVPLLLSSHLFFWPSLAKFLRFRVWSVCSYCSSASSLHPLKVEGALMFVCACMSAVELSLSLALSLACMVTILTDLASRCSQDQSQICLFRCSGTLGQLTASCMSSYSFPLNNLSQSS